MQLAKINRTTAFLACLHCNAEDGIPRHGGVFTRTGSSR
jgi:hypothetical protein